jgi:hypothetical protein
MTTWWVPLGNSDHLYEVQIGLVSRFSATQHPPLKFYDLKPVVDWSVSCRFSSQKFNLLVFLIGIADHAGPLV